MPKTPARILLIKDVKDFGSVLEQPESLHSEELPKNDAKLYWSKSPESAPRWARNVFPENAELHSKLLTTNIAAVLLLRHKGHIFGLTFGHGRMLIRQELIEPRFGLKVVLNRVDPESLRSIDTKSLDGFFSQTREQVPTLSPISSFGIDVEKDFIKAVTGHSTDDSIGQTITGANSFHATLDLDIANVGPLLDRLLDAYQDKAYQQDFDFIDNIAEAPKAMLSILEAELINNIATESMARIWLAPPEILDWENHGGFTFTPKGVLYDDVSLEAYLNEKIRDPRKITVKNLRDHRIFQTTADFMPGKSWSVYKCLYAEVSIKGRCYILNDGKWFEVDKDYITRIKKYLNDNLDSGPALPDYAAAQMLLPDDMGRTGEEQYNAQVAALGSYALLDKKLIKHGGSHSKIELCDLYEEDMFIHIKRYTRSSGLSHLFNQGKVSAELIWSDEEFRDKAARLIKRIGAGSNITADRPDMGNMHIVFGVVSHAKGDLQLPFFSQVALKNAVSFLKNTLNVGKVSLVKIQAVE